MNRRQILTALGIDVDAGRVDSRQVDVSLEDLATTDEVERHRECAGRLSEQPVEVTERIERTGHVSSCWSTLVSTR